MFSVHDNTIGLTVILAPDTYLPYMVRAIEDHPFFGESTHDLRTYDYRSVDGIMVPYHYKTIYNGEKLVMDWQVDNVEINKQLPETWFDGPNMTFKNENVPYRNGTLMHEVQERSTNYIYFGLPYNGTIEAMKVVHKWADLPGVWTLKLPEWFRFRQVVLEYDDFVAVLDCPPQQSHTIIAWAREKLGKPVKYIVVGDLARIHRPC